MNFPLVYYEKTCTFFLQNGDTSVTRRPAELSLNQCYFTQSSYVENYQIKDAFSMVSVAAKGGPVSLLFLQDDSKIICCNRTSKLTQTQISELSARIFRETDACHIIFEDINLEQQKGATSQFQLAFSYQENWWRKIEPETRFMTGRPLSNLRRKGRRLQEKFGQTPLEFRFERCTDADVDAVVEMNRKTLIGNNKKHSLGSDQVAIFKKNCRNSGYLAGLFVGERLIAGDIVNIVNDRAFFNVVGYDPEFGKYSPGSQVHYYALEECKRRGCKEANFLWGNSRWKSDFGARRLPVTTVIVPRNRMSVINQKFVNSVWPHAKKSMLKTVKSILLPRE